MPNKQFSFRLRNARSLSMLYNHFVITMHHCTDRNGTIQTSLHSQSDIGSDTGEPPRRRTVSRSDQVKRTHGPHAHMLVRPNARLANQNYLPARQTGVSQYTKGPRGLRVIGGGGGCYLFSIGNRQLINLLLTQSQSATQRWASAGRRAESERSPVSKLRLVIGSSQHGTGYRCARCPYACAQRRKSPRIKVT